MRRGEPAQETRSRNRARGGCSLATRPGSEKRRTKMERLFSTDRYLAQLYRSTTGGGWRCRMGEGGIGRNTKQSRPVPDAELEGVGPARSGGRGSKNGNPVTMRRSWRRRSLARSRSMPDLRRKLSPPSSKKGCRAEAAAGAEEPAQREAAAAWSEKTNLSPGLSER